MAKPPPWAPTALLLRGARRVPAGSTASRSPRAHLHLMREPSLEAEKMNLSSGEMTRQVTGSWCPRSTRMLAGSGGCTYEESGR